MILSKQKFLTNKSGFRILYSLLGKEPQLSNLAAAQRFPNNLNLPSLPVPKLDQTLDKYVKSVTPFLNETELNNTKHLLKEFSSINGIGTKLQNLLVQKAHSTENWLENWWLNTAYLEYRDPVVIYSSPGLVFPFENFENEEQMLIYTANLILSAFQYKMEIYSDKIPLDKMGKDTLDMNQYKKIFGTCRIPGKYRDRLSFNPESRYIIVAKNNNLFKLDIVSSEGSLLSLNQLISCLQVVLQESQQMGPPVGILTSENRDNWYLAYEKLLEDPDNRESLQKIEKALFFVALDNPMPEYNDSRRSMASKQFIHGGGSRGNSANRWFDKTIQFIIGTDGTVGLTYEHSPSEGQPIAVMTDYLINSIRKNCAKDLPDVKHDCYVEKLPFNIDKTVVNFIEAATRNIDKLVSNLDMNCFQFSSFGKEFVKTQKLSPDSFIQIAMQYAFYRIHRVPGAHYESAATRKYIHGRTETIRSCSIESIAFAKAMLDDNVLLSEKVSKLKEAIAAHKKYSIEAVNGFGVDRHLLGLKLIAKENDIELPEIYKDPSFTRSTHMRLSTSQVATKCDGFMCYAPLTVDGYGCCYNPRPYDINFGVSAFVEDPNTAASKFREALEESLNDMHDILSRTQKAKL